MTRFVTGRTALGILALGGLVAGATGVALAGRQSVADPEVRVARGKHLVWAIGCNDCHTPKKMGPRGPELDTARLLSGHREESNLLSRTGRHMGTSREILPPMPWEVYGRLSDEDLKSIYAYLRTIPPVKNRVPEPVIVASN